MREESKVSFDTKDKHRNLAKTQMKYLRLILIDLDDDRVPATAPPLVPLSPTVLSISILLFVFYNKVKHSYLTHTKQ